MVFIRSRTVLAIYIVKHHHRERFSYYIHDTYCIQADGTLSHSLSYVHRA